MKTLSLLVLALTLSLGLASGEAEAAKRLGGGGSLGMQRQATVPSKAPAAAPAPTAPASAATAAPAKAGTPAAAPQAGRSWMGPLAGLAAGIGLAALASHFGFGEELASIMMIAVLAMVVLAVVGYFMRKRLASQQPALAGVGGRNGLHQYAADRSEPVARPYDVAMPAAGAAANPSVSANIPADFDVAGFVRNAKVHYIRLQAANDAGNLDDIREFTTPEMFAEIKLALSERGGATQATDVVQIEADVIEVVEDASRYIVSVRFTGLVREDQSQQPEAVDEIWHLVKPSAGQGGWLLAGIQQIQ